MYQENEKKEYCKPEMEVVAFTQQCSLLEGSSCEEPGECLTTDGTE